MPVVYNDERYPELSYHLNATRTPNIPHGELDIAPFSYLTADEVRRSNAVYDRMNKYGIANKVNQDSLQQYRENQAKALWDYDNAKMDKIPTTQSTTIVEPSLATLAPKVQQNVGLVSTTNVVDPAMYSGTFGIDSKYWPVVDNSSKPVKSKTQLPVVVGSGELAMRGGYKPVPAAMDRKAPPEPPATMQYTTMAARPEVIAPTQELVDRSTPSLSNMKPVPDWARGTILEFTGQYN